VEILAPHCERCEVAGSVRRQKPEVGDIEVVCIPRRDVDLLCVPAGVCRGFIEVINRWEAVKGSPEGRYTQCILPNTDGCRLDIFIADEVNWGWIFALRTGNDEFNQRVLLRALRAANFFAEDGYIYDYSDTLSPKKVSVPEEADLFRLLKIDFIKPVDRSLQGW